MKEKIIELLLSTKRDGIENLISAMDEGGFFTAPCSGKHHLSKEGGLAEHSMNVYKVMKELTGLCGTEITDDSIIICALLHDLGKMGDHGKPNYVVNMIKDGKPTKAEPEQKYKQSEAEPYKTNKDLTYEEHEIRSVIISERWIDLSEDEETAILHHNGLFSKLDSSYSNHNYDKTKLSFLLHTADMWCSRFIEVDNADE